MHDSETYEACMAMESAEKRVLAKCDALREEVAVNFAVIRDGIRIVTEHRLVELNDSIRRSALELDILL